MRTASWWLVAVAGCSEPAPDLGAPAVGASTTGAAATGSTTGSTTDSDATTTAAGDAGDVGPPQILDLGKDVTAWTEPATVTFTATVLDPDGDLVGGVLRLADDPTDLAAFAPAEADRWRATLSWAQLADAVDLTFTGPTTLTFVAEFTDAAGGRDDATAPLTLYCPGLAGAACGGTCTDLESDPAHCGDCDQPCPTTCNAGACGPG